MIGAVAVIASFVAGRAARDAILLSTFDVSSLPLFIGIAAVISIPLVLVTGRLMVRYGPEHLMPFLNAISSVLLIVEWALLRREPAIAAVVTFLHLSSLGVVLVSGFWSIVNELFDAHAAKRQIGRIGMAATLGGIAGGIAAERVAVHLQPGSILLVLAALQAACAVVLFLLGRHSPGHAAIDDDPAPGAFAAVRRVARTPLLRLLALVIVVDAVGAAALDYVFKAEVTAAAGPERMLRVFAIFYTATSVITALVQVTTARFVIERLGVARSIAALPGTLAVSSGVALAVPGMTSAAVARGGEMVARSSIYRAAYELLYAPLLEKHKRSTKVILDVAAERAGDLLGAQVVGLVILLAPGSRPALLAVAIATGLAGLAIALRLRRGYVRELESSLRARAEHHAPSGEQVPARRMNTLGETGDHAAMSLFDLVRSAPEVREAQAAAEKTRRETAAAAAALRETLPAAGEPTDELARMVAALRSDDNARIRRALGKPLPPELAAFVVPLIARDAIGAAAIASLRAIAPKATGVLVDALLDPETDAVIRRRLPAILEHADPELTGWALWKGVGDARFEVRYRSGLVLSRLFAAGKVPRRDRDDVFVVVLRELAADPRDHGPRPEDSAPGDEDDELLRQVMRRRWPAQLEHVFNLLGLALAAEPLRIALQALHTEDRVLRGTALEYLESVLPSEVREALWPLLLAAGTAPAAAIAAAAAASRPDPIAGLRKSQPIILANLREQLRRQVTK
jgi:AAA family ATP:ADP antiporter